MKKFRIGILAIIVCLFLTGCGCANKKINEFTVKFDSNGGTIVENQTITKGEKATKPSDPTKEGYIFDGWYLDLDDASEYDFNNKVTKDITLEAKWKVATGGEVEEKPEEKPVEKACKLTCEAGYELVNGDSKDCKCQKKVVGVSSISLSQTNVTLLVGGSTTVTATVNPSNADDKTVTWKSSNTKVATVKNGKITAVAVGNATITVTAGGKSNTVNVTVTTQDKINLDAALNGMTAKNITNGGTSINYSANGCTITNTANTPSNPNVVAANGVVSKVYRDVTASAIQSTYSVVCGVESANKTVTHIVAASGYSYTVVENNNTMQDKFIVSNGVTDYTAVIGTSAKAYNASAGGALAFRGTYTKGNVYSMYFNNDANTVYALSYAG